MASKTNVMRILDQKKIEYKVYEVDPKLVIDGVTNSELINSDPNSTFKTLVTKGKSKNYYVFIIPVNESLDLKKAALAVGEKEVEMIHFKDLLSVTGYIHLGCSPIGMKKQYVTVIDNCAKSYNKIIISGGKIGLSIELSLSDLNEVLDLKYENITRS